MTGKADRDARGESAVVTSGDPRASQAGLSMLKKGGNAVDAAVATALTLGVVQPAFSGVGGGGFMLVHLAGTGESIVIDYRETAPGRATSDMFDVGPEGEAANDESSVGFKAVGVPGTFAGLALALARYGTVTLKDAARDAIEHARSGFEVGRFLAFLMRGNIDSARDKFVASPDARRSMLKPDGSTYSEGQKLVLEELGAAIERVAVGGTGEFYDGFVAAALAREMAGNGGVVSDDDLRHYRPVTREPLVAEYKGLQIVTMPPPSSGGIALIQMLKMFEGVDLRGMGPNTPSTIDLTARGLGAVWPVRQRTSDPEFADVPVEELVSNSFVARLKEKSNGGHAPAAIGHQDSSKTTHLSVIDAEGNVVALTESLECYFGSGVVVPGTGIFLNDTMHDFDPVPGKLNSVQPGKRPMSSMTPTVFFKDGAPILVLGSAGGPRIITSVLQVALNVLEHGMSVQEAIAAPRFHFQGGGGTLEVESRVPESVRRELAGMGYDVTVRGSLEYYFGGVHAITATDGVLHGGADPRRDGAALAY